MKAKSILDAYTLSSCGTCYLYPCILHHTLYSSPHPASGLNTTPKNLHLPPIVLVSLLWLLLAFA